MSVPKVPVPRSTRARFLAGAATLAGTLAAYVYGRRADKPVRVVYPGVGLYPSERPPWRRGKP